MQLGTLTLRGTLVLQAVKNNFHCDTWT